MLLEIIVLSWGCCNKKTSSHLRKLSGPNSYGNWNEHIFCGSALCPYAYIWTCSKLLTSDPLFQPQASHQHGDCPGTLKTCSNVFTFGLRHVKTYVAQTSIGKQTVNLQLFKFNRFVYSLFRLWRLIVTDRQQSWGKVMFSPCHYVIIFMVEIAYQWYRVLSGR